ncbi:MAG: hypothetical protein AAGG51_01615 [Cyanobacteria bacterium P01_G01_bin.54]
MTQHATMTALSISPRTLNPRRKPYRAIVNEQQWETQLSLPSEQQWQQTVAKVRQDIATGRITPLQRFFANAPLS